MFQVEVITEWVEYGGMVLAKAALDHPAAWWDATGQTDAQIMPDPNLVIWGGIVDGAGLAALESDPLLTMLWSEPV